MCVCMYGFILVPAQLHLEYLFQTVCVMCMTSLSDGAFGGYTNTEEGYLYFEEMMAVSVRSGLLQPDLARSWSNLNLFLAHTEKQNSANIE